MSKIDDVTIIHIEYCLSSNDDLIFGLDDAGRYVYSRRHCLSSPAVRHSLLNAVRYISRGASYAKDYDSNYWIPHRRLAEAAREYFGETTWDAYQTLVALENA
jgi:hypothetical protein